MIPVELQLTLELYYVQRLKAPEIAEILELPIGTVRSRIRRAIEQLRANMAGLADSPQPLRTTLTDLHAWAASLRGAQTP